MYSQASTLEEFSESTEWHSLIRYKKSFWGTTKSLVTAKEYFISPNGSQSPFEELKATIKGINSPNIKDMNNHPKCLYPGRVILLKKNGLISKNLSLNNCSAYKKFLKKISLESVSIIFSSYFIEKPASTFGHTFFRLRSKSSVSQNNDLLDYGVDFAARVTTSNPIIYGIKGIIGGFKGEYSLMPYYVKVKEYNDMESRDLWDYQINLTQSDKTYFQAHLFEMNRAYFNYLYFSENCSYHILSFLNAIRPDWELMDELTQNVPPVDTIYALFKSKKIIKKIKLRPSKHTEIRSNFKSLNKEQLSKFEDLISNKKSIESIKDNPNEVFTLDTYNLYIDFKEAKEALSTSLNSEVRKKYRNKKFKINGKRSTLNSTPKKISYIENYKTSPEKGHTTNRVQLRNNQDKSGNFFELEHRAALHDLLDRKIGYLPMSSTELFRTKFTYDKYQNKKVRLSEMHFVNVAALRPRSLISQNLSWIINFGISESYILSSKKLNPFAKLDLGYTFGNDSFIISTLLASEFTYVLKSDFDSVGGVGPKLKAVLSLDKFSMNLEYKYMLRTRKKISETHEGSFEARYFLSKSINLSIGYDYEDKFHQKGLAGLLYFY